MTPVLCPIHERPLRFLSRGHDAAGWYERYGDCSAMTFGPLTGKPIPCREFVEIRPARERAS